MEKIKIQPRFRNPVNRLEILKLLNINIIKRNENFSSTNTIATNNFTYRESKLWVGLFG